MAERDTSADGTDDVRDRLQALLGQPVTRIEPLAAPGSYIPNRHYRARLVDGSDVFVKQAITSWTEDVLRRESEVYEALGHRPFLPTYFGSDGGLLAVEFLGSAHWPPPWREADLDRVLTLLDQIASIPTPSGLRELGSSELLRSWHRVAEDPGPFLGLNLCDRAWLEDALEQLVASDQLPLAGDSLVHGDLRGDNLCLTQERVIFVDWAAAARGRPDFQLAGFAISFGAETGCDPERVAPQALAEVVAVLTGPSAAYAGDPAVPLAVRRQLTCHLLVALPWYARLAGLRPPVPSRS